MWVWAGVALAVIPGIIDWIDITLALKEIRK